jgi:hypothetical protein
MAARAMAVPEISEPKAEIVLPDQSLTKSLLRHSPARRNGRNKLPPSPSETFDRYLQHAIG